MRREARARYRRASLYEALDRADPEPIVAALEPLVTERRRERLRAVLGARLASVVVVMDAPHDPHNGAAVLRSCDAFGVQWVHVVARTEPFSASNAVAKGAERWVDVVEHTTTAEAVRALRAGEHRLVGAHPEGELVPADLAGIARLALVLGNEHDGISEELAAACAARVRVPMRGFVDSLNVSVTAAVLLGAATAGRRGDLEPLTLRRLYARGLVLSVPRSLDVLRAMGVVL
jgi:tRNA (guanosine-2'-O-)-methyltransferase